MILRNHIFAIFAIAALAAGCHRQPPVIDISSDKKDDYRENMVNANKYIAQSEATAIEAYITRRNWPMQQMPDGAWLWVYEKGDGAVVNADDSVTLSYSAEAINGVVIYDHVRDTVVAGRRQTMVGLDDALTGMPRGSKMRMILPSSLAYGIAGDGDRVPQSAVLILDVTIENIKH